MVAAKKTAEADKNLVAIKDLPIYAEPRKVTEYKYVEEPPLPLQKAFTGVRYWARDSYEVFASRFRPVDAALTSVKNTVVATDRYIREEWTVLPKAAAITVGGMAGFVLGMRRYGVRKFIYATTGILTMAAFCYPHETVDIVRVGVAHAQRTWEDFQKPPAPEEAKKK